MIPSASIGDLLVWLRQRLSPVSDTPGLDAQVLLGHVVGRSRSWILAHPEAKLSSHQSELLTQAIIDLDHGVPLPYVLGHWEFYGLDFIITPDTLIPRPETELLLEKALEWLQAHPTRRLAADVGTGSGCIAVSLARHISDLRVIASDISLPALRIASQNAGRYAVSDRVDYLNAKLFPTVSARFDLICANLPYIPTAVLKDLKIYGKEPDLALDGGPEGIDLIRDLLRTAPAYLAAGGLVLMEIDSSQGQRVVKLAESCFPGAQIEILPDLAGRDRLVSVQASS